MMEVNNKKKKKKKKTWSILELITKV